MNKITRILPLLLLILVQSASAELVRIEPDVYAEGADLTSVNPYVELRVADDMDVPYPLHNVTANNKGEMTAPTGTKVFGHDDIISWHGKKRFYAKFLEKTDYVSIQFTGGSRLSEEMGILKAYDENDTLLDVVYTGNLLNGQFATMQITRNSLDISYIVAYTKMGDAGILDNFRFNANPEIQVEDSESNILTSGAGLISMGNSTLGVTVSKTFTIRNVGPGKLTRISLATAGSHYADFAGKNLGATSVAPGESTTFTVEFTPSIQGTRTATLRINSDDKDENPFEVPLTGEGDLHPTQEIAVQDPDGTFIEDGAEDLAYDSAIIGTSLVKTITIHNFGQQNLTNISTVVSGANASDFTCSTPTATTLAAGASATFTVTFSPTGLNARTATLHIASNDADENTFDIGLGGTGQPIPAPDISVLENSLGILTDGSSTLAFGRTVVGKTVTKTIVIRNAGTADLSNLSLSLSGAGAADYVAGSLSATTVAPLANIKVTLSFKPSTTGFKNAMLRIASNDPDENPFNITLNGTAILLPEIVIRQGWGSLGLLVDNISTRDFGDATVGRSMRTMAFTVRNTGNAPLQNIDLKITGLKKDNFKIVQFPAKSIAPGESSTFKIAFKPVILGVSWVTLHVLSNDSDENPFQIKLRGKGI